MKRYIKHMQKYGLPGEAVSVLKTIDLQKVMIDAKKGQCLLQVKNSQNIDPDLLSNLAKCLQKAIPSSKNIEFIFENESEDKASLLDFIKTNKKSVLAYIGEKAPSAYSFVNHAKWEVKDKMIDIFLPHELAIECCEKHSLLEHIKKFFGHHGYVVAVRFSRAAGVMEELEEYCCNLGNQSQSLGDKKIAKNDVQVKMEKNRVYLGKVISKKPLASITMIQEEEKSVVLVGWIKNLEIRELKSKRVLLIFDLLDKESGISVKSFIDPEKNDGTYKQLKKNTCVIVSGRVETDRYTQELTLMATNINSYSMPVRKDDAKRKRIEMHLHTKMSTMDSVVEVGKVVERAAYWGHKAVAITDHGVVQAFPEAYDAGQKHGVKIIYGVEGYLIDDFAFSETPNQEMNWKKNPSYHVIILVKKQEGLQDFYRLISDSHLNHFYRRPRILKSKLAACRDNLLIGSACEAGELYRGLLENKNEDEIREIVDFYDYLEIQPLGNNEFLLRKQLVNNEEELRRLNRQIITLGEKYQKKVVATGDVHFLDQEDSIYREILMAGKGFEDVQQPPLYYRTTEEMLAEFNYLSPEQAQEIVVDNPNLLCEEIEDVLPIPKELYSPEIDGAEEQVESMILGTAKKMYGDHLPEIVQKRVDKELHSIISNGFAVLYLIAQKLVKKSNDDGYLVGSRGSVGSSLAATMMGITEVNPLPPHYRCSSCLYSSFVEDGSVGCGPDMPDAICPNCGKKLIKDGFDIPFEVFLGFHGDKTPDIDLNFSGDYQPRAHAYVGELFGEDHVFKAGTISTIADKTAYGFVKNYLDEKGCRMRDAEINRLVAGCAGSKRTTGQHPGGLMVVPTENDIHQFCPIQRPADDTKSDIITTHFDYHSISSRLVKLDVLGHDDPTVIKMLEDLTGIDARTIALDDPETMSLFSSTEALEVKPEILGSPVGTYGIPEFGTNFVRKMLVDTQPKTFSELIRISGFSHGTDVWLNNAQELVTSGIAKTSEAISTRDDIMMSLIYYGLDSGLAFKIMEDVRKGKGLKPEYEAEMREHGVPDWFIGSCKKIKYMFPKGHAVAYVMMAFRIAWYKVNYPEAYYATFFTVRANEFDANLVVGGIDFVRQEIKEISAKGRDASVKEKNTLIFLEIALEMYARGINMLPISLEKSLADKFQILSEGLLPPLSALAGVGVSAAENIVLARGEKSFASWDDLKIRGKASKTVIEALANHGALKDIPKSSQMELFDVF